MSAAKQLFPVTGDGKPPAEKSKFAQTCNRLSLYLKEKGNLRHINAKFDPPKGVHPAAKPTTVDFLSSMNNVCGEKAKNILPEYVNLEDSCVELDDPSSSKLAAVQTSSGQMSIFYKGKVMVVDDVPEDRAKYVMLVAKYGVPAADADKVVQDLASTSQQINNGRVLEETKLLGDSDLPIARRASLNKFLAKRKDRATLRAAPYQLHNHSPSSSHSFDLNM